MAVEAQGSVDGGAAPPLIRAYLLTDERAYPISPAPAHRDWMERIPDDYARRCLPLLMANQAGWEIRNPIAFTARWDGGRTADAMTVRWEGGASPWIDTRFGNGIVTWWLPLLFRTPPGYMLLARGPANRPKDGASPLEGLVETDWAVATFTISWKLTRPGLDVEFSAGEPICMLVPTRPGDLESFDAELAAVDSDPQAAAGYGAWSDSRQRFMASFGADASLIDAPPRAPDKRAAGPPWQRHYFHGRAPGGEQAPAHRTRLRLRAFDGQAPAEPAPGAPASRARDAPVTHQEEIGAGRGASADGLPTLPSWLDLDELRPIVAGAQRWAETELVIDLGGREVAVAGDRAELQAVLAGCDGSRTVAELAAEHGPDSRALLTELNEAGALIDCQQAWRVLHAQGSVPVELGRGMTPLELSRLQQQTYRPAPTAEPGVDVAPSSCALGELASRRRSALPSDERVEVSFADLSALLAAACRLERDPESGLILGSAPSAGAMHPLIVHVLVRDGPHELDPGIWWYDPEQMRLHRTREGLVEAGELFIADPVSDRLLAAGQPVLFLSVDLERPTRKYAARGYRYALIEVGAAMQSAYLAATELGVPVRAIGGFDDRAARALLDLPGEAVCMLAMSAGG